MIIYYGLDVNRYNIFYSKNGFLLLTFRCLTDRNCYIFFRRLLDFNLLRRTINGRKLAPFFKKEVGSFFGNIKYSKNSKEP